MSAFLPALRWNAYVFLRTPFYVFYPMPRMRRIRAGSGILIRAGLKFLFVDDHAAMRQVLRELLTLPSDDVREAADGAEAEAVFEDQRPDWVVMDVQMTPVGGLVATGHIMARHPEARVVIVSQFDDPDLRDRAAEVGARAYLTKDDLSPLQPMIHAIPA